MVSTILTDIEGTTSSISFVKEVLFPYARRALPAFVREHGDEPDVRRWLDQVATESGGICSDDVIVETLQGWIDQDRKHTALKALQGMLWKDGYARGDFRGHVYPDAGAALHDWHAAGRRLAVFSSGSVGAQKLLFGHSEAGDLASLFDAFFDTEVGHKREADSYRRRRSCSCRTWSRNWTPRAKPACARSCSTDARITRRPAPARLHMAIAG
jgi:enolase-phosphatase E1